MYHTYSDFWKRKRKEVNKKCVLIQPHQKRNKLSKIQVIDQILLSMLCITNAPFIKKNSNQYLYFQKENVFFGKITKI